jgi:adenylate cyclase
MARLVDALADYGVRLAVFDVIFAEPDRTSLPQVFQALDRDIPGYRPPLSEAEIAAQPDNDRILAEAMHRLPVVLGVTLAKPTAAAGEAGPSRALEHLPKIDFERRRDQRYLPRAGYATSSLPALQQAAAANGVLDVRAGSDGVSRLVPLLFKVDRRTVPGLAAAAVAVAEGGDIRAETRRPGLSAVVIGGHRAPTDRYGAMRLYDSGSKRARYVSAADVLTGTAPAEALAGSIAIIGAGAEGLNDLRLTPLSQWVPGMETHAQAIEQLLSDTYLTRPDWASGLETAITAMFGLLLMLAVWMMWPALPPWSISVLAALGFCAAAWFGFAERRILLDPVLPAATLLLAAALERFLLVLELRRDRQAVRGAFARYLAPALVEQLAQDPDRLRLGGEMREMTFLFCDIRGFTSISERFDPEGLTRLINRFLTPLTDVILARGGTIDKYMGDCIMAFWNAPLADTSHALNACEASLAMFQSLEALNAELAAEAAEDESPIVLRIGIGLNTGACVVGNMGSQQRFDYSVLGDAVNLASRLEGQSKTYGVGILIGEQTRASAPDFAALELDLIAVKGRAAAARIYALLGDADVARTPAFQELTAAQSSLLTAYRAQDWSAARAALARCRSIAAGHWDLDALYDLYEERLADYEANPPGPDWDGVYVAAMK